MKANATVQVQSNDVTVTEWSFAPGEETGHHIHTHKYVIVPLSSGTLRIAEEDHVRETQLETGASYEGVIGTAHNVINANDYEFRFIEIELR